MSQTVSIPIADLLLDNKNARLGDEQDSQQETYHSLARLQGKRLVAMAKSILENGLDPSTLPIVMATGDQHRRYTVLEGNRRVLALKALETPSIVLGALSAKEQKSLATLSARYARDPIEQVACILVDDDAEAQKWILLRHTGANDGAGLMPWDANEVDRYRERHNGARRRTLGGQVLDLVNAVDGPSENSRIMTNVNRLVASPSIRNRLGLAMVDGELSSWYPAGEVMKGLRRVISDLQTGTIKVGDIYLQADREEYLSNFPSTDLPDPTTKMTSTLSFEQLKAGDTVAPAAKSTNPPRKKARVKEVRTTLITKSSAVNPAHPRLNSIVNEFSTLNVETHQNAVAVLLRVFLELTLDQYLDHHSIERKDARGNEVDLRARIKLVSAHLEEAHRINANLRRTINHRVADTAKTVLNPTTYTFNQYVHNLNTIPRASELYAAWDELEPFLREAIKP